MVRSSDSKWLYLQTSSHVALPSCGHLSLGGVSGRIECCFSESNVLVLVGGLLHFDFRVAGVC